MLRRTIAILAISGALIGFVVSLLLPRRYVGRASLTADTPAQIESAAERTLSPATLSPIILQSPYYLPILNYTPLEELVQKVRDNASIVPGRNAVCTVVFTDDDKYVASDMTHNLVEAMRGNLGNARVTVPVHVATTGPGNALCTFEGLAAGLLCGLCVWFAVSRSF